VSQGPGASYKVILGGGAFYVVYFRGFLFGVVVLRQKVGEVCLKGEKEGKHWYCGWLRNLNEILLYLGH